MTSVNSLTRSLAVITATALAVTVAGCGGDDDAGAVASGGPIVVAADLELSGADAAAGQAFQRALELRVDQLNGSGLAGGRTIKLVVKDNRSDPGESLRNIQDFSADRAVSAIIMGACAPCAVNAARTLNDKAIPAISLAAAGAVASPVAERRFMFKLGPNANDNAAALAAELSRTPALRKVGLLYTADGYGAEGATALDRELGKVGLKLAAKTEVKPTEDNLDDPIEQLVADAPDGILVWTGAEQAVKAASAAAEAEYQGRLFLDAAAAGDLFLGGRDGSTPDGTTMVFTQTMVIDDVIATTPAKAARKQWFRDYTARWGSYYGIASFAADALQLVTDATLRADADPATPDRSAIRDQIEMSQMDGLSGPIRLTPDNHSGLMRQSLTMLVARGGRWRLAG
ncbi:branched-chain amino acid transport system substrate-binding protein [Asanoa hainanensis]|uniref:Branched-chain amino acid transport system substrate-binding protein n=1 Tax=Asanoa hainanensis TaxID=560556 RepID=A0A239J5E8_9ACTN|nr:ABC transporter substrate-binding protein [Asanoa hainanensis]SNT01035.1 branched-chain amino acid transport system substrate-binding protein [Asanoa hainanensis]